MVAFTIPIHRILTYCRKITSDFDAQTESAVQRSVVQEPCGSPERCTDTKWTTLVKMWCLSIWQFSMPSLVGLTQPISTEIVRRYFRFMFALGWQTTEILYTSGQSVPHLYA